MSVKIISGVFNGTGAALYVGIGFIPDKVRVWNLESNVPIEACWSRDMRSAEQIGGTVTSTAVARYTVGAGLGPYRGGDIAASGNTAYLAPFASVYSGKTNNVVAAYAGAAVKVSKWTLGNSGNKTGNFDHEVSTSYVGEGSRVLIRVPGAGVWKDYDVFVTALTSNGEAANEVTLSEAVPSGDVLFIGPMYDYVAANAGQVLPAGFAIYSTALSVSGEMIGFEATNWTA